jgi:hypothetical protein
VDRVWSNELLAKLERLTPKQAAAIPRLAETLVRGGSVDSLLAGSGRICARQTYYGRPNGWTHQEPFRDALDLAKREYRQALARDSVEEARALLYTHAPEAAKELATIISTAEETAQRRLAARDLLKMALALVESGEEGVLQSDSQAVVRTLEELSDDELAAIAAGSGAGAAKA